MKKIILLVLCVPLLAYGQINETFEPGSTGNWTEGVAGHWKADTAGSLSGKFSLHHVFDNPESGSDCIGLPMADLHPEEGTTQWKFLIRHGCDPSSSNNWAVYLMSDTDPASFYGGSPASGYAVGVNLSGYDDTLRLWKVKNGTVSVLLSADLNWQNDVGMANAAEIRAERSEEGEWRLSVFDAESNLLGSGAGYDNELFAAGWFIINYRYSSTRDRLLWFDNVEIYGTFYRDTLPPSVKECTIPGRKWLQLVFDEEISEGMSAPQDFITGDPLNAVTEIKCINNTYFILEFSEEFINKSENSLKIRQICDKQGNCARDIEVKFMPVWAETGDVIISEIMADPLPEVKLPGKEYFEIYNRSEFVIDTEGWTFLAGEQKILMPAIKIPQGGYVIFCSVADTSLFREYGRTTALKPFPALIDSGKLICLSDSTGSLIHGVEYSSEWYDSALKKEGGWSLEIIDTEYPFYMEGNWEASSSVKGGTPGKANSVSRTNPDNSFSGILNVFPDDSLTVHIQFSETVLSLALNPGSITTDNDPATSVIPTDPLLREFRLKSAKRLSAGIVYNLHLSGEVTDASGNPAVRNSFIFGVPEEPSRGDIVFNELLFNPLPGDPDYVELVNFSEKTIDASQLYLASVSETGDTSKPYSVSDKKRCIIPAAFYVVTTNGSGVIERYPSSDPEFIFNSGSLPSMPDDRGHLLLLSREMAVIDEVIYTDEMHFPLLAGAEGISLEKIRPDAESLTGMNWHSASESSGWGTPGRENSVYSSVPTADDQIIFSSGRISPDNDGYEDMLVIDLNLEGPGNVVTISVFNETGGFIRRIAENMLAGNHATVVWDGTYKNGSLVDTGIYIFLIELFNDKGKTRSWKKICTVLR